MAAKRGHRRSPASAKLGPGALAQNPDLADLYLRQIEDDLRAVLTELTVFGYFGGSHPRYRRATQVQRILKAVSFELGSPKAETPALDALEKKARPWLKKHGLDVQLSRPVAATVLRAEVVERTQASASEPQGTATAIVAWLVSSLRECGTIFGAIGVDLPPGFHTRRREAERAARRVLEDPPSRSRSVNAEALVRAVLGALGYPTGKARSLFDRVRD